MTRFLFSKDAFTITVRSMILILSYTTIDEVYAEEVRFKLDTNEPMKAVQSFCPALFCSRNEEFSRLDGSRNRCCIPCKCSATCNLTVTDTHNEKKRPSLDFTEENCIKTAVGRDVIEADEYLLIQTCPSHEREGKNGYSETFGKCVQPNSRQMDELMPVFSNTTGKNYRNIYCAYCNHDYNITAWKSKIKCPFIFFMIMIQPSVFGGRLLLEHIRQHQGNECILKWEPKPGTASLCVKESKIVSSCNPLHRHSEKFQRLCQEIHAPVRLQETIYKNVFCLDCNENIDKCLEPDENNGKQLTVVFKSEVFAVNQTDDRVDYRGTLARSTYNLVYDSLLVGIVGSFTNNPSVMLKTREYIRKACPLFHVNVSGTCVPLFEEISGIAFDYRLKLIYPKDRFSLSTDETVFADVRHLVNHYNDTDTSMCAENILDVATESEHITVKIQFVKKVNKLSSYYDDFKMFKNKINLFNKRASNGEYQFSVEMFNPLFVEVFADFLAFAMYSDFKKVGICFRSIAMAEEQFCDLVVIYEAPCENGIVYLNNGITFQPGEYIKRFHTIESVYVCYDLYFSKMMKIKGFTSSAADGRSFSMAVVKLVLLLLSSYM